MANVFCQLEELRRGSVFGFTLSNVVESGNRMRVMR